MQDHDLDAPNLDTVREPHGRSRLFLEDDPSIRRCGEIVLLTSRNRRNGEQDFRHGGIKRGQS
jgi:hypothetical protein